MATLQAPQPPPPPQPKSLWCLKKERPANWGEMEPPTPTTPSTRPQQLLKKKKNRQHTYQRNAADSKRATPKNRAVSPGQFST